MIIPKRFSVISRIILNGIAGIGVELLLVYLFIMSGLVVCLVWWGVLG